MSDSLGVIYTALHNSFDNATHNKSEFRLSAVEVQPIGDISLGHVLNGVNYGVKVPLLNNFP